MFANSPSPYESSRLTCEALNHQRNVDMHRTHQVTKAVLCDTQPTPCVSEFLFSHELYWSEKKAQSVGGIKCARWRRDIDWPTREPHLAREASPDFGGLWESVLSHMPNRTLWLHGDSIMTQVCEAALCSLVSALCTAIVINPIDVVRTRLLAQPTMGGGCSKSGQWYSCAGPAKTAGDCISIYQ